MTAFKILVFLILVLSSVGSLVEKNDKMRTSSTAVFAISGILYLLAEAITQATKFVN